MGKSPFSFVEHKRVGARLKVVRQALQQLEVAIGNAYPVTSKANRLCTRAVTAVDALKCELDSQMFKDCPLHAKTDAWKGVYYGPDAESDA